jgi:putative inorganic carbon (HCO3(-)) transporter
MEQSIEYPVVGARPHRWIREAPELVQTDGPKIAFKLLIVFLLVLYSNVSVIYKLDAYRPALVIAVAALGAMVIELGQLRQSFKLMWPQSAMVLAFFGACIISTPVAFWVSHAVDQTIDLGKIILVYLLLENVITSAQRLRQIMFTLLIGGIFPAIGTIGHYKDGILVEHSRAAWRGIFGNPNELAYGLVILVPIALVLASESRWPVRIGIWMVLAVYMVAIFLTFSRGGLIALFAVVVLMGWKQKSTVIRVAMGVALLVGIAAVGMFWTRSSGGFSNIKQDGSVQERMVTLEAGMRMFLRNPLLGVGPGDSSVAYALYAGRDANCGCHDQLVVHNAYIQALAEVGLTGFIPFMLFIFVSVYEAWKLEAGPIGPYAKALGLAMWGLIICCASGGFVYTWWPYILVGLIAAAKRIKDSIKMETA